MSMTRDDESWASGSDLRREARVLWAHRWLVVVVTILIVGLAAAYTFLQTPVYTATATVLIQPTGLDLSQIGGIDMTKVISPETETAIATSRQVAADATQALMSDPSTSTEFASATPDSLLKHLSVEVPVGSQVMQVHYSDPVKQKAVDGAGAFAQAYIDYRKTKAEGAVKAQQAAIDDQIAAIQSQIKTATPAEKDSLENQLGTLRVQLTDTYSVNTDPGTIVSPPVLPTAPSSPNKQLNLALGVFAGLFAGVGLAFLKHRTDNRLKERQQLEGTLGAPVLSVIPRVEGWRNQAEAKLITIADPLAPAAESYRVLRPVILAAAADRGVKTIMIVSPMAGEGKSTTAANLSVVLAQSGRKVALLSVDLRRPRAHQFFEVSNEPGISDLLTGNATLAEIGRRCDATVGGDLTVYPAGRLRAQPAELLQSRQMQRFLEELREGYDFVILDCPPVLAVSDALPLIPISDGVLFVADAETTTREQVAHARDRLLQMGAVLLGAVINGMSSSSSGYYDYRYAYTSETSSNGSGSKRHRRSTKRSGTKA